MVKLSDYSVESGTVKRFSKNLREWCCYRPNQVFLSFPD
nr:MAG TPA: hypothetical protein [Caudoviricetes sp.]